MKKIFAFLLVAFVALSVVSCNKEPRPGKLVGDVTYRDRSLEGVEVTLTGDVETFTFTTIANGYFYFNELAPGDYIVSCKYNGKSPSCYLRNYEKGEHPTRITILEGTLHTRNVVIPDSEDLGMDNEED